MNQDGGNAPEEIPAPASPTALQLEGRGRVLSLAAIAALTGVTAWWSPPALTIIWENIGILAPMGAGVGMCLYIGFPLKHNKLPSLDSAVVGMMASLVVVESVTAIADLWGSGAVDKAKCIGPLIFMLAGLKAMQRAFKMADENNQEPTLR